MKKLARLRCSAASLQTGFRHTTKTYAFLLLAAFGLSSCENGDFCDDARPTTACNIFATVEDDGCHEGALGTAWLRLDNGDLLLPQTISGPAPKLENGQRVMLGYTVLQTEPAYSIKCNYLVQPEEPDMAVQVNCLQPIFKCGTEPGSCNTYVTAERVICGGGVWYNLWLKRDNGQFLQPWENNTSTTSLVAGQRYKIGYEIITRDSRHNNQVICQAMPPAADAIRITCLETVADTSAALK